MFSGFLIKISIIRDIFNSVTGEEKVTGGRWIQTNSDELGRRYERLSTSFGAFTEIKKYFIFFFFFYIFLGDFFLFVRTFL
jgi:hypothetical protein